MSTGGLLRPKGLLGFKTMRYLLLVLVLTTALAACSNNDENINEAAEKMAQDAREKVDEVIGGGPPQSIDEAIQRVR